MQKFTTPRKSKRGSNDGELAIPLDTIRDSSDDSSMRHRRRKSTLGESLRNLFTPTKQEDVDADKRRSINPGLRPWDPLNAAANGKGGVKVKQRIAKTFFANERTLLQW